MPRTGRGGVRQGTVGQAYGNRTDLNASMPVQTATGQGYGVASEQQAAQRSIPVASQPVPGATVASPTPQAQPATVSEQVAPPTQFYPGELKFDHPTEYPNEPTTAGVDIGPGAGSEALIMTQPSFAERIGSMARVPGASAILFDLASAARNLGL